MAQPGGGAEPAAEAGRGESEHAEHAELERLRAEVEELRASQREKPASDRGRRSGRAGRWRAPVAVVAIVLACVLAPLSVAGVWAASQVSNTDRYVANMAPLIKQPPIQDALTTKITGAITSNLNIQAQTSSVASQLSQRGLPRLAALLNNFSGSIASGIDGTIHSAVARVVASPVMVTVWTQANRTAHTAMVAVLSGQGNGAVRLVDGNVVLSLGPFIKRVQQQLTAQGLRIASLIPQDLNPTFTLFAAPNLERAQAGYRLINTLRWVLPVLSLVLFVLGIWVARSRRRALMGAALGLSASMLVLAAALAIARAIYLNSVPQSALPPDAAAVLYDTLIRFLREGLRVLLVAGLVIAAAAFLTGPSAAAVQTRRAVTSGLGRVRDWGERRGMRTGKAGQWVGAHKTVLRISAVAVVALIFVFWGQPSVALVIWLVVLLLVVLGLIELAGGRGPSAVTAPRPRAGT